MTKLTTFLAFFIVLGASAQESQRIFGKVSDGNQPMANVDVSILEKEEKTVTDSEGAYEIYVQEGDKLQFAYTGMKTITIRVEDVTRVLNPVMVPEVTELDEVVVKKSRRRSQKDLEEDYEINQNIIRTAWGYTDASRVAGQVRFLNENQISSVSLCILDLLRSEFPGVRVLGNCSAGGTVSVRGSSSLQNRRYAIYDVDGQIFVDAPIWLDVHNFKRVAIFNNLASTAQYGNIAAGGVVVINTFTANKRDGRLVDRARLRNNYFTEKTLTDAEVKRNMPNYQKELDLASSFESAKEIFRTNQKKYANSPYFFLDTFHYFSSNWNDADYAKSIIDNNYSLFNGNAVLLKALAYSYEEYGMYEKANEAYKDAFIARPNYAQSYMDMANSYRNIEQHKQAASMYARYGYLLEEGFMEVDTVGFGPIMNREFNNLLMLEKDAVVDSKKGAKLYVAEEDFKGTRLVFEWSDGEAEFDLQFVNPGNQYHVWKHSLADNDDIITREKEFGYNVTEYLVDGSLPGSWSVNVNYSGNKSLTPTYLKATIYHNYGLKSQRKETKVFKLSLKNVNQELFKLQIASNEKL